MMEFEFPKYNIDLDFDDDTGFPFDDQRLNPPPVDPSTSQSNIPPSGSTGYPFSSRSDDTRLHFDDHLRDIAARYPEFAEHIRPATGGPVSGRSRGAFPRGERIRGDPWGRDEFDFAREFDIPAEFDSRFARPREFYPPNTQTYSSSPPYQSESRPPVYPQGTPPPPTGPKPAQAPTQSQTTPKVQPPTSGKVGAACNPIPSTQGGIQQSSTVDLGQVQPPRAQGSSAGGAEPRGQRSMSAPPTNGGRAAAGGKRYVSSIQIPVLQQGVPKGPVNNPQGVGQQGQQATDMGTSNSTPKQQPLPHQPQHTPNRPHEYVIPIHIEGRDEPITPKQQPPLNNQQYTQQPPTTNQPLFNAMKDQFKQQQEQVQKEQQQKFYEEELDPQNKPQIIKPTPLEMIQSIQKDVSELMSRVDKFTGKPRDKEYIYLEEMLTRNLLKLDTVETEGKDAIRQARREAIKCIEGCINILEAKANANVANAAVLAIENKGEDVVSAGVVISTSGVENVVEAISDSKQDVTNT